MNTEDKEYDERAEDFKLGQLDASLLDFAQDRKSSVGAERKTARLSAVGAEKKTFKKQ